MERISPDQTLSWADKRNFTLSQRIWSNRQDMRHRIDETLRNGILNGESVDDVANDLIAYVRPSFSRYGSGKARYAANRLAGQEMRRANALATRDVAATDPAGGYLRYVTASSHVEADTCDDRANHNEGFGRGVYPAKDAPLPPEHIGCRCHVAEVGVRTDDMAAFVEKLRVEYGLQDPEDMSPDDLVIFRRETGAIRQAVELMFRAWFEQIGLVSREQLVATSPTVAGWVESVQADKRRRVRE